MPNTRLTSRPTLIATAVAALALVALIYAVLRPGAFGGLAGRPQTGAPQSPAALGDVPTGAVMFFNLAVCPVDWSELTAARGRYVVGLNSGGSLASITGTALTNNETRAVGQHSHSPSDPGHGHSVTDPGHGHTAASTDSGHIHAITDPGHTHDVTNIWLSQGPSDTLDGATGKSLDAGNRTSASSTTGVTVDSGTANITTIVQSSTTGATVNSSTTGLTIAPTGSVAGTNAPYIQLLVCQKN